MADPRPVLLVLPVLPGGYAEPLHILEPSAWAIWYRTALALLLLAAATGLWRWWRRWWRERPSTRPAPRPADTDIDGRIDQIQEKYRYKARRRDGFYQLSTLVRQQLERRKGQPFTRMTARESRQSLGDSAQSRCLLLLSDLRFGRAVADRQAFDDACDRVRAVVGAKGKTT